MRIHRFYLNTLIHGKKFDIADRDLVHQWKKVFRYNVGSQVIVFDGNGVDYHCIISSLRGLGATLTVIREIRQENLEPRKNVWLFPALIKKDNLDHVVQKATEIGVNNITPALSEHSEKKKINLERLKKIAIEASEQSGRGDIPTIHPLTKIEQIFLDGALPQEKIVLDPNGMSFRQYRDSTNHMSVAVFVGPEGGFSPKEIDFFKSYNVKQVSLGQQILRAETASISIASLLLLQ